MSNPEATEHELVELFLEGLRALPDVRAEFRPLQPFRAQSGRAYHAWVDLSVAGKTIPLRLETRKTLFPRDARQVLWSIKSYGRESHAESRMHEAVPVLLAESISPGARKLLMDERVGYFDSGGSLFLSAPGVYVYIGRPPPKPFLRAMRFLFSGRRAQVLHSLLMRHEDWFGVTTLAKQSGVSPATTSQVLTELGRFDWLESRGQGPRKERHLREPAALLDEWVRQLALTRPLSMRRYYVPSIRTEVLIEQIDQVLSAHGVEYAITHEAAAQRYAPYLSRLSQVRCHVVTSSASDRAIGELGARAVSEGFNLVVVEVPSPGDLLFRERVDGIWLASPVRVYLDLMQSEGRAKEMAEHLRRERIGF